MFRFLLLATLILFFAEEARCGCGPKKMCDPDCESKVDESGCWTCDCGSNPCKSKKCLTTEVCQVTTVNRKQIAECTPKCESLSRCSAKCDYGRKQDSNGCEICECLNPCQTKTCKADERCEVRQRICSSDELVCPFAGICVKKCDTPCNLTCAVHEADGRGCKKCQCKDLCKDNTCEPGLVCKPCTEAPCAQLYYCVPECKPIKCATVCKYGYEVNEDGCSTCECTDPCKDKSCSDSEVCIPQQVKCLTPPCKYIGHCYDKSSSCSCSGDPHCTTFDGAGRWDYQGACKIVLTKSIANSGLPEFVVYLKNMNLYGSTLASYVEWIQVEIASQIARIERKTQSVFSPLLLKIDGRVVDIPFVSSQGDYNVSYFGTDLRLVSSSGMSIDFGKAYTVSVTLPPVYMNKTEGFCGNYDGVLTNDNVLRNGKRVADVGRDTGRQIGDSWIVADDDEASEKCKAPDSITSTCTGTSTRCKLLSKLDGPFAECLKHMDKDEAKSYLEDCQYDFILMGCDEARMCDSLDHFATQCALLGYGAAWRSKDTCPCQCADPNAECRKEPSSACQPTCSRIDDEITCSLGTVVDTCICKKGFLLFNSTCVKKEQCGCTNTNGQAILPGATWLENDCSTKYTCSPSGTLSLSVYSCLDSETCLGEKCVPNLTTAAANYPTLVSTTTTTKTPYNVADATTVYATRTTGTKKSSYEKCKVDVQDRVDCKIPYASEKLCLSNNCCYEESNVGGSRTISCFQAKPIKIQQCDELVDCAPCKSGYNKDEKTNCNICSCVDPCEKNKCSAIQDCKPSDDNSTYKCIDKCCAKPTTPRSCDIYTLKNKCQTCKTSCKDLNCGPSRMCCEDFYGCKTCDAPVKCYS